jgi:quercetin dioxygenase-like cupin family protein
MDMKQLELIEKFNIGAFLSGDKSKEVRELYNGARRRMVEVKLSDGAVLTKHKAMEPISVLCLSGNGKFTAGANLEESLDLSAGVLITLDAGVEHEVTAAPEIHLLVTKFKDL